MFINRIALFITLYASVSTNAYSGSQGGGGGAPPAIHLECISATLFDTCDQQSFAEKGPTSKIETHIALAVARAVRITTPGVLPIVTVLEYEVPDEFIKKLEAASPKE